MTPPALLAVAGDVVAAALFGGLVTFTPVAVKWLIVYLKARSDQTRQARVDTIEEWRQYANTVIADREVIKGERDAERAARDRERRESALAREQERKDAEAVNRECEQRVARLSAVVARTIAWVRALEATLRAQKIPVEPFDPDPDADSSGTHPPVRRPADGA